jgi:hypothetical protein
MNPGVSKYLTEQQQQQMKINQESDASAATYSAIASNNRSSVQTLSEHNADKAVSLNRSSIASRAKILWNGPSTIVNLLFFVDLEMTDVLTPVADNDILEIYGKQSHFFIILIIFFWVANSGFWCYSDLRRIKKTQESYLVKTKNCDDFKKLQKQCSAWSR